MTGSEPNTITKKELVNRIADQTGQTKVVVKDILQKTARDVTSGTCFPRPGMGTAATVGHDIATGYGLVDAHRAVLVAPVGQQFVERPGIDHRARKDMRADFRSLLEDADREVGIELLQPDRRRQAGRPAAHDHDVIGHGFPFAHLCCPILPAARAVPCAINIGVQ